jgi:two-component system chemotaxis sensor kinase CheA
MDDLVSEFITETSESIGLLDQELVKLEQNPNDKGILGNIFRLVHTIKGTCGFLGLPRLESVAHAGENVLGKIRDGEIVVTPQAISLVLEALDRIKTLIEYLAENGREPDGEDSELIDQLNIFADTAGVSGGAVKPASGGKAHAETNVANMLAPAEIKEGSGKFNQEELDALERAFNEAAPTIDGGIDFSKAPEIDWDAIVGAAPAPEPAPAVPATKPVISDSAKEKALKQGLEADAKEGGGGGVANQSIRVNLDMLESLMQMVGELVLTRNQLMQVVRNREDRELKGPLQQLSQITSELQESIMKTRMQPISTAWSKFPRLIRDLSHELHKKIDLKMIGEHTELDRQLLEMIKDPLTHMVRNSCDHGLETPDLRVAAKKPETGTVTLSAYHEGGHIIIEIADDGRGINLDRVKQKAIENGIATADEIQSLSDEQIMQFIFRAGFSTAEKVTSVSGRGVGMDVVRTNIEKIGGTIALSSKMGKGSTFHIKIPLTLAIVSVLIVESHGQRFAIPQLNVIELVRVGSESEYKLEHINHSPVLRLRDKLLPLVSLRDILGQEMRDAAEQAYEGYIAVIRVGASDFGLVVDRIHDTEEIVVKPVSRLLESIPVYSGNTILGDGSVIMILDPNGLAKALGDLDLSSRNDAGNASATGEKVTSFLVFRAGEGAPKAVPLELVSRLEEIDAANVEHSGQNPVIQYRGELMRLHSINHTPLANKGLIQVVVFSYDGHTVGMIVEEIIDIIEAPIAIKIGSQDPAYLGSMVIGNKTTDVVDVAYLLKSLIAKQPVNAAEPKNTLAGMRVLYVEDSLFFRNLTVPYFTQEGVAVTTASDGEEALAILDNKGGMAFDMIVTDIEMPKINGLELAIAMRRDERFKHLPIVAFTSTAGNENFRNQAKDAGINHMVNKTERHQLLEVMARYSVQTQEAA